MAVAHGGNIFGAARESGVAVSDILDFSANINPLGLSPKARSRIRRELGLVRHYPDRSQQELRTIVAAEHDINPECILFGNGATQLIHLVVRCLRPARALIADPCFGEYRAALQSAQCQVTGFALPAEDQFRLDRDQFTGFIRDQNPELVIVTNPNNPTGLTVPSEDLVEIAKACARCRAHLLIDESFIEFTDLPSLVHNAARQQLLIVLRSFTKFFAIPGLRIGYLVADPATLRRFDSHLEPWSVNTLATIAAAESLRDREYQRKTLALIARERKCVFAALDRLGWLEPLPSEANFLLVRIKAGDLDGYALRRRLETHNILIRDASGFEQLGAEYVRIAIRTAAENTRLLQALKTLTAEIHRKGASA